MTPISLTAVSTFVHRNGMPGRIRRRFPPRSLRRAFTPRAQRAAYWAVGIDRLTVAIIEPGDVEPVLSTSATVRSKAQTLICPGILETALLVDAAALPHFVALEPPCCRCCPVWPDKAEIGPAASASSADPADSANPADPAASANPANPAGSAELAGPRYSAGPWEPSAGSDYSQMESEPSAVEEREALIDVEASGNFRVVASTSALRGLYRVFRSARMNLRRVHCGDIARLCLAAHLGDPEPVPDAAEREQARLDPLAAVSLAAGCDLDREAGASHLCVPVGLALMVMNPGLVERAGRYRLQDRSRVGDRATDAD